MIKPQIEYINNKILLELTKTVEMFGLTSTESRLFAYLYLAEHPMTLDEMAEALGKSKTSMSTSIRSLADQNLVTRVWKKGVRKSLYRAQTQLFKSLMISHLNKWIDDANQQKQSFEELEKLLKEIANEHNEKHLSEIKRMQEHVQYLIHFHQEIENIFNKIKQD